MIQDAERRQPRCLGDKHSPLFGLYDDALRHWQDLHDNKISLNGRQQALAHGGPPAMEIIAVM